LTRRPASLSSALGTSGRLGVLDAAECRPYPCTAEWFKAWARGGSSACATSERPGDEFEAGAKRLIARGSRPPMLCGIARAAPPLRRTGWSPVRQARAWQIPMSCVPPPSAIAAHRLRLFTGQRLADCYDPAGRPQRHQDGLKRSFCPPVFPQGHSGTGGGCGVTNTKLEDRCLAHPSRPRPEWTDSSVLYGCRWRVSQAA